MEDHDSSLEEVLKRVVVKDFHLNIEKCGFAVFIQFLGHEISSRTICTHPGNIKVVKETSISKDVDVVKHVLEM